MKMFRAVLTGVVPAFVLLVCIQLNARVPCTPPPSQSRQLLFEDRVAYQRAIEEVYWRHRIWPKQRPDPKPALDAVMSKATIEKKVQDYLRNSELLEQEWQKPITPEQLQAEMERMAQHSKQPEVLRELFAALGNDPFVIAECLARPVLAERFANGDPVAAAPNAFGAAHPAQMLPQKPVLAGLAKAETQVPVTMAAATANYALPTISDSPSGCIDDSWTATTTTNAPTARFHHTAVWTGTEMIVWGGCSDVSCGNDLNTGGRYNPSTDSWTATSATNAPTARAVHRAVWSGSEMIVWGGVASGPTYLNTGGRYNPDTNSWTATKTTNAPTGRYNHTAVWTGSEMIVWGGIAGTTFFNTGGRYNPSTDSWIATTTLHAPSRRYVHTAVWTGSEMIVWGGVNNSGVLKTGGRYNPSTDSWTVTSTTNAPSGRSNHTAVWTGSEMIVWGGADNFQVLNTGGRYNPSTDSWAATNTTNAPTGRYNHTAVLSSSEMIVWGGFDGSSTYFNTGGRYNPGTDSWTATSTTNAPTGRYNPTAVWTGSEMIVWGGRDGLNIFNTGGRYCAHAVGGGLTLDSAASIQRGFAIDLPLSGTSGVEDRSGGPNKKFYVAMTFNNNITSVGSATTTCGAVSTWSISGTTVTFNLIGVAHGCNESDITITANDVMDDMGNTLSSASVTMGLLLGDVNGDRVVDGTDLSIVRSYRGQHTDGTNYRSDVSNDGFINASDIQLVQQQQGTSLP